jgi:hypothetical protein
MGPAAKGAIPDLVSVTQKPNEMYSEDRVFISALVRLSAAKALWNIDQRVNPALRVARESLSVNNIAVIFGDPFCGLRAAASLRKEAAELLGNIGVKARDAIPDLKAVAANDDFLTVREAAMAAIQKIEQSSQGAH